MNNENPPSIDNRYCFTEIPKGCSCKLRAGPFQVLTKLKMLCRLIYNLFSLFIRLYITLYHPTWSLLNLIHHDSRAYPLILVH